MQVRTDRTLTSAVRTTARQWQSSIARDTDTNSERAMTPDAAAEGRRSADPRVVEARCRARADVRCARIARPDVRGAAYERRTSRSCTARDRPTRDGRSPMGDRAVCTTARAIAVAKKTRSGRARTDQRTIAAQHDELRGRRARGRQANQDGACRRSIARSSRRSRLRRRSKRLAGRSFRSIGCRVSTARSIRPARALGPVAGITPFNFPSTCVAHKVAPALAAGIP